MLNNNTFRNHVQILPALKTAIIIAIGIALCYWIAFDLILLGTLTTLFLLLSVLFDRFWIGQLFLMLSLISVGGLSYRCNLPTNEFQPTKISLQGIITQPPIYYDKWMSFPISIEQMGQSTDMEKESGKVWVRLMDVDHRIHSGVKVNVSGSLQPMRPRRNPGDFDLKGWRQRNGYIGTMFIGSSSSVEVIDTSLSWIYRARTGIASEIKHYFKNDAPFITALMLGIRRDIDEDMLENLRKAGLSHLLALSGLHVGFLTGILWGIGALFRLKYNWRVVWVILFLILFLMIVPHRSSTLRATIMAVSFLIAPLFRRWSHPANTIGVAALVVLCLRPGDLFDVGFQLSFAAVGGILFFKPAYEPYILTLKRSSGRLRRLTIRYFIVPLLISTSASIMVMPLTSYHFGTMALGSPIFNIFAIPFLALVYAGSWTVLMFSMLVPWLAGLLADGLSGILYLWKEMVVLLGAIAPVYAVRISPVVTGSMIVFVCVASRFKRKISFIFLLLSVVALFLFDNVLAKPIRFQAWFLDVGHGDAAVWRFPNGRTVVIDGGPTWRNHDIGRMAQILDYWNCHQIDLLVASHPEADHISGLIELVEHFPVGLAIASPNVSPSLNYALLCSLSTIKNVYWHKATNGMNIKKLGSDYNLEVLGPPVGKRWWSSNDASLVLRLNVRIGDDSLRILTAGDIERLGEDALILSGSSIESDLLKVSHHGSGTSNSIEFIDAVQPKVAIISRGISDKMGSKLSSEVMSLLENRDIETYSTHTKGAILCEPAADSSGTHWKVVNWRKPDYIRWLFGL